MNLKHGYQSLEDDPCFNWPSYAVNQLYIATVENTAFGIEQSKGECPSYMSQVH